MAPARGTAEWVRYLYWLHFAEGSAMPPLLMNSSCNRLATAPPWPIRPIVAAVVRRAERQDHRRRGSPTTSNLMEAELIVRSGSPATPSRLGHSMSYPIEASVRRAGLDQRRPKLMAYLERIRGRPAYRAQSSVAATPCRRPLERPAGRHRTSGRRADRLSEAIRQDG